MTTLIEDLEATKAWLENHEWGQGPLREREAAPSYCVLEAIHAVTTPCPPGPHHIKRFAAVENALREAMGMEPILFNDKHAKSKGDIIAAIDKAIEAS